MACRSVLGGSTKDSQPPITAEVRSVIGADTLIERRRYDPHWGCVSRAHDIHPEQHYEIEAMSVQTSAYVGVGRAATVTSAVGQSRRLDLGAITSVNLSERTSSPPVGRSHSGHERNAPMKKPLSEAASLFGFPADCPQQFKKAVDERLNRGVLLQIDEPLLLPIKEYLRTATRASILI